jgi:hypothetical protein
VAEKKTVCVHHRFGDTILMQQNQPRLVIPS